MNKKLSLLLAAMSLALIVPQAAQAIIIDAQVSSVTGKAFVLQPGSSTQLELKPGMALAPGSTVITESGSVGLQLMPGAVTVIEPSSELSLTKLDYEKKSDDSLKRNVLLDLKKGSVLSNLEKVGTSDFKIKTPYGVAAARGTTWKTSTGKVSVYESTVEVTLKSGKVITIGRGTFVEIRNGEASDVQAITQEELNEVMEQLKEAGFKVDGDGRVFEPQAAPGAPALFQVNPANLTGEERSQNKSSGSAPTPTPIPTPTPN